MSKKEKISLHRGEDLERIDEELDVAMEGLAEANERVTDILASDESGESDEEENTANASERITALPAPRAEGE